MHLAYIRVEEKYIEYFGYTGSEWPILGIPRLVIGMAVFR
jgi:hypothetical protein